ncbi:hypothetical protein E0Z10_g2039 [Xylaria hypoxylon]|uniref:RRM domain-containing protein n=1 Tax=Xylaria hypoxylon TaxID=37992 RepID=A0A4Z0YQW5_9PEZI|nr:hypothetical protein E0Z10_g2039 [Xylaria hypoxylon]
MDPLVNGCCSSVAAVKQAARRSLDDLVSFPRNTDNQVTDDAARERRHIDVTRATNDADYAELLEIAHSCTVRNPEATDKTCRTILAKAMIDNAKDKLEKMEVVATRIKGRSDLIKKMEQHLKTYINICQSLRILVTPHNDRIDYSYKIDPREGVGLVIRLRDIEEEQVRLGNHSNLVDSHVLPPISTPVLAPTRGSITASSTSVPSTKTKVSEPKDEGNFIGPMPKPTPRFPVSQIWKREAEHFSVPHATQLVFQYGIQYIPSRPSTAAIVEHQKTRQSRMVVFSGLDPGTTWMDLVDRVRGGPVLRVVRANPTTAFVYFVKGEHAHAYVKHINDGSLRNGPLKIQGRIAHVTLAPTPSYPIRNSLMQNIEQRGVTRCLAFPHYDAVFGRLLEVFLTRQKIQDYTATQQLGVESTIGNEEEDEAQGRNSDASLELAEEWVIVDHDKPTDVAKKPTTDMIHLAFRDVVHAQDAYRLVCGEFPYCGVYYAPDCCTGPLDELEGSVA